MGEEGVFEVEGADPFAAGFNEIFCAVDDFDEAFVVHGGDIAGLEPAVLGPAMGLIGSIVVAGGDPRAAHFELAGSFAAARSLQGFSCGAGTRGAQLDKRSGPALLAADSRALVLRARPHVAVEAGQRAAGGCLR